MALEAVPYESFTFPLQLGFAIVQQDFKPEPTNPDDYSKETLSNNCRFDPESRYCPFFFGTFPSSHQPPRKYSVQHRNVFSPTSPRRATLNILLPVVWPFLLFPNDSAASAILGFLICALEVAW